jgi:hypothetical protein
MSFEAHRAKLGLSRPQRHSEPLNPRGHAGRMSLPSDAKCMIYFRISAFQYLSFLVVPHKSRRRLRRSMRE